MKQIENHCVGCGDMYPCIGAGCSRRHVEVYYCDKCGEEIDDVYEADDEDLCEDCLKEKFKKYI